MEQQERTMQKQAPQEEQKHEETVRVQKSPGSGWVAQALLAGAPIWDLPQQSLAQLAEQMGNSGMLALASMRSLEAQRRETVFTGSEPLTDPTAVPEMPCALRPAAELTAGSWPSAAFDPAGLG